MNRPSAITVILLLMTSFSVYSQTPKELGYRFPDEWEPRHGTMMIFPSAEGYGRQTKALRNDFRQIAQAIAAREPVFVYCLEKETADCRKALSGIENIDIVPGDFRIDWARDNGPMVLVGPDGEVATAGFRFNGWGKKYRGWKRDVDTRDNIARAMEWPIFHSDLVLEGGAIEIAGGIGIVTESCVLNPNRTDWGKDRVEKELKDMLGLDQIIWLKSGLMPDPITDGHVDGICKFIAPSVVMLHSVDLKSDPNFVICRDAKATLLAHGLEVIDLPLSDDMVHMNFYIGSGGETIYVPICGDPEQDEPALEVLRDHFDEVIAIEANALAEAGGGIHCYTQQIPRSISAGRAPRD